MPPKLAPEHGADLPTSEFERKMRERFPLAEQEWIDAFENREVYVDSSAFLTNLFWKKLPAVNKYLSHRGKTWIINTPSDTILRLQELSLSANTDKAEKAKYAILQLNLLREKEQLHICDSVNTIRITDKNLLCNLAENANTNVSIITTRASEAYRIREYMNDFVKLYIFRKKANTYLYEIDDCVVQVESRFRRKGKANTYYRYTYYRYLYEIQKSTPNTLTSSSSPKGYNEVVYVDHHALRSLTFLERDAQILSMRYQIRTHPKSISRLIKFICNVGDLSETAEEVLTHIEDLWLSDILRITTTDAPTNQKQIPVIFGSYKQARSTLRRKPLNQVIYYYDSGQLYHCAPGSKKYIRLTPAKELFL